ncbi:hypothetical protein HY967_02690 [Candidatus Jorgensenbacteria bacterium]|nr:hypothetical protein [Candidatus Jorgensenbacteria bacterium]
MELKDCSGFGLDEFAEHSENHPGVMLQEIPEEDLIVVHTRHGSVYLIAMVNRNQGIVAVQGSGQFLRRTTLCHLNGSTMGGSAIKPGWLGLDMCLELRILGTNQTITTSLIHYIEILKKPVEAKLLIEAVVEEEGGSGWAIL